MRGRRCVLYGYTRAVWLHACCMATRVLYGYTRAVWLHACCMATCVLYGYTRAVRLDVPKRWPSSRAY
jgi:hypothetical protein